ncbi:uncharacterized protein LOC128547104 [Mercenaria mercenaria]|uniref:uncharacterized protein LOC128547104 n=1 Tax=Mercenaria mercenaria TaxID=6596 RepID=UPI00234F1F03|nr:uncharacterized protein LOC128547104 [Mercenaria mercenaria]
MHLYLQAIVGLLVTMCLYALVDAHCVHPPYAKANKTALYRKIFHDYYVGRWTFNIIREYRSNAEHIVERRKERNKGGYFRLGKYNRFQSRLYGEPKCRRQSSTNSSLTCPWYVVVDVDLNREPQTMAKAKCSCNRCLSAGGTEQRGGRCATVNTYVPVIKWECPETYSDTDTYYRYFIHLEEVPVGCTCRSPTKGNI